MAAVVREQPRRRLAVLVVPLRLDGEGTHHGQPEQADRDANERENRERHAPEYNTPSPYPQLSCGTAAPPGAGSQSLGD